MAAGGLFPNARRVYAGALDRLAAELGPRRQLAAVPGDEIAAALRRLVRMPAGALTRPRCPSFGRFAQVGASSVSRGMSQSLSGRVRRRALL